MFLTPAELKDLTETSRKDKQISWLRARGWPFEIGEKGHPRVLKSYMLVKLGGSPQNDGAPKVHLRHAATQTQ